MTISVSKFSDFIYSQRVRQDLTCMSPDVARVVFKPDTEYSVDSPKIISFKDDIEKFLKPIEIRVTKSKEQGKNFHTYMLFCTKNLRIYNNVEEYLKDSEELNKNNLLIKKKIDNLKQLISMSGGNIVEKEEPLDIFVEEGFVPSVPF